MQRKSVMVNLPIDMITVIRKCVIAEDTSFDDYIENAVKQLSSYENMKEVVNGQGGN